MLIPHFVRHQQVMRKVVPLNTSSFGIYLEMLAKKWKNMVSGESAHDRQRRTQDIQHGQG